MNSLKIVILEKEERLWKCFYQLYDYEVKKGNILHEPLSLDEFRNKLSAQGGQKDFTTVLVAEEEGKAFACGCVDLKSGKCFVNLVMVREEERHKGMGTAVLRKLEELLAVQGNRNSIEISFFNPVTFSWRIADKEGVTHPNTPGVDVASDAYLFFKNCGYRDFAIQNSYYLSLQQYRYPPDMEKHKRKLEAEGILFVAYDNTIHHGMEEMLKRLENPLWEKELSEEPPLSKGGRQILVPVYENQVCGFTGPLDVERSGRGYFAGIAVDPSFRGKGLAKVLFCTLCDSLKTMGADYMTLFTGENNPARNIYEAAGFSIVRTWADMRKDKDYGG